VTYLENAKQFDPVRPGEQWFFYWKTSAALWEGRIAQFPQDEVIFIPVYWGFHAESQTQWDFGKIRPERDLHRLVQILTQHGRKFCWILPLTPAPYLPNGGVPVWAARTLSISAEGVHLAVFDQEQNLNKMFSFFGPKVFQSFEQFLKNFGEFLGQHHIKAPVWGAQFFYHQNLQNVSFLEDSSVAFEQGFSRYLKQNQTDLTDAKKESQLKDQFTQEVGNLFKTAAESALAPFWMGVQKIITLGSGPQETILRSLPSGKSQLEYTKDLFHHFVHSDWISSVLLGFNEKKESLGRILYEQFGSKEINQRYQYESFARELSADFRPYGIIDIFGGHKNHHFRHLGLYAFLNQHFKWLYHVHDELPFNSNWIEANHHKIKFFVAQDLDRTTFGQVLKLFMMGQIILLDTSGLIESLDKKLQVFMLENNLKSQSVNFMTSIQICELGEGRLILFQGDRLKENPNREKFWRHIFQYLNLVQPEIIADEDVFSVWRIRATSPHELSYLDVRRVNIYNPTSYKKNVSIKTHKHFAFMKMIDPTKANAKSTPDGVDIELLPNGKIALDFGHYEEN
jgi:hypothetical protein